MADTRPIVYKDPILDLWVYRASSVGRSLRCLVAARQQYDPLPAPQYLLNAAEAGSNAEPIIKEELRSQGWGISGEQDVVEIKVGETALVRGHLDAGTAVFDNREGILEVKTMSSNVFKKWMTDGFSVFPSYAAQVSTYMHGADQPAHYIAKNRDDGDVDYRWIPEPIIPWHRIEQRVLLAEYMGDRDQLPVCDVTAEYSCPYEYLCDKRDYLFAEIESGEERVFRGLLEQYAEVLKMENDIKGRKEELRQDLVSAMGVRSKIQTSGWSLTYETPKPRKTLDVIELRKKLGDDLDNYWLHSKPNKMLTVRKRST